MDVVIFRENTEDVYAGIEWEAESEGANRVIRFLGEQLGAKIRPGSGIGIKPISAIGTKNLVRKAVRFAIEQQRPSVTLVHKGNIMKYTEGAFRVWGYELAAEEFGDRTLSEDALWAEHDGTMPEDGRVLYKGPDRGLDVSADLDATGRIRRDRDSELEW